MAERCEEEEEGLLVPRQRGLEEKSQLSNKFGQFYESNPIPTNN